MTAAGAAGRARLLDTGIFLAYVRGGPTGRQIETTYSLLNDPAPPLYSIVTDGEIRVLAARSGWGPSRIGQLSDLLSRFTRISLEAPGVLEAYVDIDVYSLDIGRVMGKNDLWIAATANATGAILLTTDSDFDHLDPAFLTRIRIDPA